MTSAVLANDAERVRALIAAGEDVNKRAGSWESDYADTALHTAAEYGSADAARALIEGGADVNAPRNTGATPLHLAAWHGSDEVARVLLEAGADPNRRDGSGDTPLNNVDIASSRGWVGRPPGPNRWAGVESLLVAAGGIRTDHRAEANRRYVNTAADPEYWEAEEDEWEGEYANSGPQDVLEEALDSMIEVLGDYSEGQHQIEAARRADQAFIERAGRESSTAYEEEALAAKSPATTAGEPFLRRGETEEYPCQYVTPPQRPTTEPPARVSLRDCYREALKAHPGGGGVLAFSCDSPGRPAWKEAQCRYEAECEAEDREAARQNEASTKEWRLAERNAEREWRERHDPFGNWCVQ